jgi:hypothetical protein
MALQQKAIIDKIEVLELCQLQIRQRNDIYDDANPSVTISSAYSRWVLNPGDSTANQDAKVIAIANVLWTPEVIAAYQAEKIKNELPVLDTPTA